jgi:hypothetical protein
MTSNSLAMKATGEIGTRSGRGGPESRRERLMRLETLFFGRALIVGE